MSEEGTENQQAPRPVLEAMTQYVKDMSFENPGAPAALTARPQIDMGVDLQARRVEGDMFEVELKLRINAANEGKPLFLLELAYADPVTPDVELSSTQNPSLPGEAVTLTAVVHSSAGIPSGTVTFRDIDAVLADHVRLDSNGVASFTTSALSEGSRRIVAVYDGDANNHAARSRRLAQSVGGEPSEPRGRRRTGLQGAAPR